MNKEQLRRKKALAAARRDSWLFWTLAVLAVVTTGAWIVMFLIWE